MKYLQICKAVYGNTGARRKADDILTEGEGRKQTRKGGAERMTSGDQERGGEIKGKKMMSEGKTSQSSQTLDTARNTEDTETEEHR